jgi:hypothetical protein
VAQREPDKWLAQRPHRKVTVMGTVPRLGRIIGPLVIAPVGAMVVSALQAMLDGRGAVSSITMAWVVGFFSLVAGFVLVLPVMWLAPRLRQPPLWLAAIWGMLVAWCVVVGVLYRQLPSTGGFVGLSLSGAASGLVYAFLAKSLPTIEKNEAEG